MRVQVAFYRGSESWIHGVIRWVTRSPVSHCEVVLDGQGYTPKRGYSRLYQRPPAEYQSPDWVMVPVNWDATLVRTFVDAHMAIEYDTKSLLAHVLPIHDSPVALNCAEFVVNLASFCRDPRLHNRAAWRFSPGHLFRVLGRGNG